MSELHSSLKSHDGRIAVPFHLLKVGGGHGHLFGDAKYQFAGATDNLSSVREQDFETNLSGIL